MPVPLPSLAALLAQGATTTTTSVPRMVGEPLNSWIVVAAAVALLVVILVAGFLVRHRMRQSEQRGG